MKIYHLILLAIGPSLAVAQQCRLSCRDSESQQVCPSYIGCDSDCDFTQKTCQGESQERAACEQEIAACKNACECSDLVWLLVPEDGFGSTTLDNSWRMNRKSKHGHLAHHEIASIHYKEVVQPNTVIHAPSKGWQPSLERYVSMCTDEQPRTGFLDLSSSTPEDAKFQMMVRSLWTSTSAIWLLFASRLFASTIKTCR